VVSAHVSGDERVDKNSPVHVVRIGDKDIRRRSLGLLARRQAVARFQKELDSWLAAEYQEYKPDFAIVSSVSVWANVCTRFDLPYAICVHGGDAFGKRTDFLRSYYRQFVVRSVLRRASAIFTNSHFTAAQVSALGGFRGDIVTTYCGVARDFIEVVDAENICDNRPQNGHKLLMMCRLVPIKACDVVLHAVALLARKYPDVLLGIAGDGPLRQALEDQAQKLGILNNVKFLGYVNDVSIKAALFRDCHIYVQTGRLDPREGRPEAFGIVFAEAGMCCRPVVGPRIGGVPEVISDGVSGCLVEPDDPESLMVAVDGLLSDPDAAQRMGLAGREKVLNNFSYSRIAKKIVEQMKQVI